MLHHVCEGEGSPTVILEAGLGSDSQGWQPLQDELAALTRTCRYDRAGLGRSGELTAGDPRTTAEHVEELAELLESAGIEPPYVFAGHSYGGSLARLYAYTHRDDVSGLVLIDTPHPDERARYLAALPEADDDPVVARLRAQLGMLHDPAANPERLDWEASMAEVRAADDLGDLPLVVITAGRAGPRAVADLRPELVEPLEEVRMELQRDLAALSGNGVHVVASESGHSVPDPQSGQPEVILTAIDALVRASRLSVPLPPCDALFTQPRTQCAAPG